MEQMIMDKRLEPKRICKILIKQGLITKHQAIDVLKKKDRIKQKLEKRLNKDRDDMSEGEIPVTIIDVISALNLHRADDPEKKIDEESVYQFLAEAWNYPYEKIDPLKLDLNIVTTTIPKSFAKKYLVLPIAIKDGTLTVATSDPLNMEVIEDIIRVSHMKVRVVVSSKTDIIRLIDEFFGFKRSIAAAENEFDSIGVDLGNLEQYVKLSAGGELPSNDHHIVQAVNYLFSYAIDQRASDIHIEPKREISLVRMRIDGVLHTVYQLPKKVHRAIISRIKNLSRMDMSETRRPQDGRVKIDKGGVEVEIRISSIPVAFGEKVVMRILDADVMFQDVPVPRRRLHSEDPSLPECGQRSAEDAAAGDQARLRQAGAIRSVFDGRYRYTRYFSPRQFNQPRTLEGIFALNDVELIDLETDPDETRNLAVERKKHGELLLAMNGAMNALIEARVGERDDGSFLPGEEGDWAAACFDP